MNYLNHGLIVPALVLLAPLTTGAADALPTTRLLPVITESESGEPLSAAERSTPFMGHLGDIAELGFVEAEYEISGTGNIYDYVDDEAQSAVVEIVESDIPYATRMLVRRPANAVDFNGTVYIEYLNSTASWDDDPFWRMSAESFSNVGSVYIGITSDTVTVEFLRDRWGNPEDPGDPDDPQGFPPRNRDRYENLTMDRFGQIWDIFSQAAILLRDDDNPDNPLMGFGVERIIQTGYSQSAGFVKTYANSMHERDVEEYGFPAYDGYFGSVGGFSAKKINPPPPGEGDDFNGYGDPRRLITVDAPAIRFQAETEMLGIFNAHTGRQVETGEPDSPKIRTYEMAGGVHVDIKLESTGQLIRERDLGFAPEPKDCSNPVIPISTTYIQSALLRAMEAWIRDGAEPPPSSLIELGFDESMAQVVIFDDNGNAVGGVRSPQIEVPLGQYIANPFTIFEPCFLEGAFVEFDEERFKELYPTDQFYRAEVDRAISRAVADGFILAEDTDSLREAMLADAGVSDGGAGGGGSDSDNFFGCTLGSNGRPDPTFPALVMISLAYLARRKWQRVRQ